MNNTYKKKIIDLPKFSKDKIHKTESSKLFCEQLKSIKKQGIDITKILPILLKTNTSIYYITKYTGVDAKYLREENYERCTKHITKYLIENGYDVQ